MKKLIYIATVLTFFYACGGADQSDKKAQLEKLKAERDALNQKISTLEGELSKSDTNMVDGKLVETTLMQLQAFNAYVDVYGKVDADENISLCAEMGGIVTKVYVKTGDEISEGQLLAETDNKVIVQGIAEIQNALDLANTVFIKQKNLWDQKIGTEVQFLTAKNQKESLEKRMATMQQQLEMTRIKSPINGTVDAVDTKVGQMAIPGMPIIRVVNFSKLKVKADIPENYAGKIKKGDDVIIVLPDMGDTIYAKVNFAAKVISPLNRTFQIEMLLNNKKQYHPNMIATVKVVNYKNEKALVIPLSVVMNTNNQSFVMTEENGKAKKVLVKIGTTYNGKAEIVDGLKEGDKLIVKGFQEINEGDAIRF